MTHKIGSILELEALYGSPAEASFRKVSDRLTPAYERMIEASPFDAEKYDAALAERQAKTLY